MNNLRRRFLRLAAGACAVPAISCRAWGLSARRARFGSSWLCGRRAERHSRASDRSTLVAAPRPAVHRREPAGRGQQSCNRGRHTRACGRVYAVAGRIAERDQCHPLRQPRFQFHPRYRTGRWPDPWRSFHVGAPLGSSHDASRVHRLRQGESGQALIRFGWVGRDHPFDARAVQAGGGGLDILHVPYRGVAPALTDLLGGRVQVVFANPAPSIGYIRAGKLRALAITTATRSEALPDIPAIGEFVRGYEASSIFGLGAPRNTPAEIVDSLNKEFNAALVDPTFKANLQNWMLRCLAGRRPISECSLLRKPTSGPG